MSSIYVVGLSRSGTTLLTTILDSHSDISMGYELIPPKLGSLKEVVTSIKNAQNNGAITAREVSKLLPEQCSNGCGVFIKRSARALITPDLLVEVLQNFSCKNTDNPKTISERTLLASAIVDRKQQLEGTKSSGFKIPITLVDELKRGAEAVRIIAVIRDPRDVFSSQLKRKMTVSAKSFSGQWDLYAAKILSYEQSGAIDIVIRYEDMVSNLDVTINTIQEKLKIKKDAQMRDFYKSKASIHAPGQKHVNSKELSRDVFDTSINRWREDLADEEAVLIESICKKNMQQFGYTTDDSVRERRYFCRQLRYAFMFFLKKCVR
jgi:hypothetical protein